MNRVSFTTNLDKKLLECIKIIAIRENKDVNEIIEHLFKEYIKEKNQEGLQCR